MKECNWCKSQVNRDAKICPKCGKRIWEKKHKKGIKAVGIILAIILFIFILLIILISTTPAPTEQCNKATQITLNEVQDAIKTNSQKAMETYNGNYYILEGKIIHIYSKELEIKDINGIYSIFVKFNSSYKDKILDLKVGDTIKYCGKMKISSSSYGIDNACILTD